MKRKIIQRRVPKVISVMETKYFPVYITVDGLEFDSEIKAEKHEREIQNAIDFYNHMNKMNKAYSLDLLEKTYYDYENHRSEWLSSDYSTTFLAWQYGLKTFLRRKGVVII